MKDLLTTVTAVSFELPEKLATQLNLRAPAPAGNEDQQAYLDEENARGNAQKVLYLLSAAAQLCALNFPKLSEVEWVYLFNAMQFPNAEAEGRNLALALRPGVDFFCGQIASEHGKGIFDREDLSRIKMLDQNHALAIFRVVDLFWSRTDERMLDLREILSAVSGLPRECVLFGDPAPEDLWALWCIENNQHHVFEASFTYAGALVAQMTFHVSDDGKEAIGRELVCTETRPLVTPGQSLESVLAGLALPAVFEAAGAA